MPGDEVGVAKLDLVVHARFTLPLVSGSGMRYMLAVGKRPTILEVAGTTLRT